MNFLVLFAAACIPTLLGFVYYHPKVMGGAWLKAAGLSEDSPKHNMALTFGVSFFLSLMLAFSLQMSVIHQFGLHSMMMDISDTDGHLKQMMTELVAKSGSRYLSFKHGLFHGVIMSLFLGLPMMGTNALFEGKSFKYIGINLLYWTLCLGIMGGILCQFITLPAM